MHARTIDYIELESHGRLPVKLMMGTLYVTDEVTSKLKKWRNIQVTKRGQSYYWVADEHNTILIHRLGTTSRYEL